MGARVWWLSLFTLLILVVGCSNDSQTHHSKSAKLDLFTAQTQWAEDSITALSIKTMVARIEFESRSLAGERIFSTHHLPRLYDRVSYRPLWGENVNRNDLITALASAKEQGLLPLDYHLEIIVKLAGSYDLLSYKEVALCDILLSDAVFMYGYHLQKGKINPALLDSTWNYADKSLSETLASQLRAALDEKGITKFLKSLEPQDYGYQQIKKQLIALLQVQRTGGWEKVRVSTPLYLGEHDKNIPKLRERLIVEGYLDAEESSSSQVYDSVMVSAIMHFQKTHGVHSDGVVGKGTLKLLQVTARRKVQILQVNLERRRWIPSNLKDEPSLVVNIASFTLHFMEGGQSTYSCGVIVGKHHKETPVFVDTLETVVLNPTWLAPYSITSTETLHKLQKNPDYLHEKNMVLLTRKGKKIATKGIDWSRYTEKYFPFLVRQEPSEQNALGRVKFLFPNKHSIYLHDTPEKELFSKEERDFSHGCIRVDKALDLALLILKKEDTQWSKERVDTLIATNSTHRISLTTRYPVQILYATVEIDSKGELYYYHDVYGRDQRIYDMLMSTETTQELLGSLKI